MNVFGRMSIIPKCDDGFSRNSSVEIEFILRILMNMNMKQNIQYDVIHSKYTDVNRF